MFLNYDPVSVSFQRSSDKKEVTSTDARARGATIIVYYKPGDHGKQFITLV